MGQPVMRTRGLARQLMAMLLALQERTLEDCKSPMVLWSPSSLLSS